MGRDGGVGEAAAAQVVERRLAVVALGQDAMVEGDGSLERVAQPLAPCILARRALADLDTGAAGKRRQSLVDAIKLFSDRGLLRTESA